MDKLKYHIKPEVSISTHVQNHQIEIAISDNGPGILDEIKDKIFQPFFATNPAGQVTGLGLSLSYDIITRGHNGDLKMVSEEKKGSTFLSILPVQQLQQ